MAEVVFHNLEDMLPHLEELEREGVFKHEELRVIIKKRTDFEYKLQKRIMEKKDILNYLEYEMKLDLLRKKRSKKLKLKPYNTAALGMNRKIHALFRKGLMKFQDDLNLWMQYIDFCKKTGSPRAIGLAYGKLLQQHANNPDVWLLAAKHETEEMNNIENARLLFQKALRTNNNSQQLWHEYFRLELLHVDKIKKRNKMLLDGGVEVHNEEEPKPEKMEDFLLNKTAEIVFNNAIMIIDNNIDFRLKFVNICEQFEDTEQLEDHIYNTLLSDFHEKESLYEALCMRPIMEAKRKLFIIKDADWVRVESEVDCKFQDVVEKKKTATMFEKYFNCFAKLMKDSNSPEQIQRRLELVLKILDNSEQNKCVTELMYIFWSELLIQIGKDAIALNCLKRALKLYNKSLPIWQSYLFMKMKIVNSWEPIRKEFKKCISSIDESDHLSVWKFYVDTSMTVSEEETKLAFEEVLKSRKEVRDSFLPQYLNWIYKTQGLSAARQLYSKYLKGIVDQNFIQTCIELENIQDEKNIKQLRFLHEKAITDYGYKSCEVWISYICFEKEYAAEDFDRTAKIYLRAKKTLKGKLNAEFITQYSLI